MQWGTEPRALMGEGESHVGREGDSLWSHTSVVTCKGRRNHIYKDTRGRYFPNYKHIHNRNPLKFPLTSLSVAQDRHQRAVARRNNQKGILGWVLFGPRV
jgi:hypothetical protein